MPCDAGGMPEAPHYIWWRFSPVQVRLRKRFGQSKPGFCPPGRRGDVICRCGPPAMCRRVLMRWGQAMRSSIAGLVFLAATAAGSAQDVAAPPSESCGEVVTVATHDRSTTRYALARNDAAPGQSAPIALVLLVGGGGVLDLDGRGCPRALTRNSL